MNTTELLILLQHITLKLNLGPPACLDDNTAYYGYNIRIRWINGDSSTCQQRCQRRNGCNFWSFYKGGKCFLKTSKAGEYRYTRKYGPVRKGNNHKYVSGSKYCTHVSNTYQVYATYSSPYVIMYTNNVCRLEWGGDERSQADRDMRHEKIFTLFQKYLCRFTS